MRKPEQAWKERLDEMEAMLARKSVDTRDKSLPCYQPKGTTPRWIVRYNTPNRADRRRKARIIDREVRRAERAVRRIEIRQEFENGLGSTNSV